MDISAITGGELDEQQKRQLTGRGGFIDRYRPRVIEPAKQTPLGVIWKARLKDRKEPFTIVSLTGETPNPLHGKAPNPLVDRVPKWYPYPDERNRAHWASTPS